MILFERSRVRLRMALVLALALAVAVGVIPVGAHAAVLAQAGTVEILFTPGDPVDRRIIAAIDDARHDVHVLAYSFTHPGIAKALIAARGRGVEVQVVADAHQATALPHTMLPDLRRRGIAVWLAAGFGSAHNKVVIVDAGMPGATTVTGSFNFTRAAQSHNAENVVIFHHNRDVAKVYERYFERRRASARRWDADAAAAKQSNRGYRD